MMPRPADVGTPACAGMRFVTQLSSGRADFDESGPHAEVRGETPASHEGLPPVTITSLLTAMTIGIVIGLTGRFLVPAGRDIPFWVPLAVGVGAALLGTVTARLAGVDTSGVSAIEVLLQTVFAGIAVAMVAATADRRPSQRSYDRTGGQR